MPHGHKVDALLPASHLLPLEGGGERGGKEKSHEEERDPPGPGTSKLPRNPRYSCSYLPGCVDGTTTMPASRELGNAGFKENSVYHAALKRAGILLAREKGGMNIASLGGPSS